MGVRVEKQLTDQFPVFILKLTTEGSAITLSNRFHEFPEVEFAEPDFFAGHVGSYIPNDPQLNQQYSIDNDGSIPAGGLNGADMRVDDAWDVTTGCSEITIAILDDGIDLNHPDLQSNLVPGFDALGQNSQGMRFPGETHGTACAGTAAAKGDNGIGVAGVAYDCSIMPIRMFSDTFATTTGGHFLGFVWATDNGADVLSNSWTWSQSGLLDLGIWYASIVGRNGKGCVILASAGNSNNTTVSYPARNPWVISVGASNFCDERKRSTSDASFLADTATCGTNTNADPQGVSCDMDSCWGSSYGVDAELVAPGISVMTTFDNNRYSWFWGTSAACPNAAGVAALVLSANPELTRQEVREVLASTARKLGNYSYASLNNKTYGTWNVEVGYGIPHARNAVDNALQLGITYVQNETLSAPPIADIREGIYGLFAGRNVTPATPQGPVLVQSPAPITFFQAGNKVLLRPGFKAGQNTNFTARITQPQCPVKQ